MFPFVIGAYKVRVNLPDTQFRRAYERGDLPIAVEHRGFKNVIKWKVGMPSFPESKTCTFSDAINILAFTERANTKLLLLCEADE